MPRVASEDPGIPPRELPPLPTFLIIGAQKSATRWLRDNLGSHPEIFTAPTEVGFFHLPRRYRELGVDWYRSKFDGWAGEPIVGESTPGYMMLWNHPHEVAARIVDDASGRPPARRAAQSDRPRQLRTRAPHDA